MQQYEIQKGDISVKNNVGCLLQVMNEVLPEVEEFRYLEVLLMIEGRLEHEINRQIAAVSAVLHTLCQSVVVNGELRCKTKVSVYQAVYGPTLTHSYELWVVTKRRRSQTTLKNESVPKLMRFTFVQK